jgi:signal transduction histidine kinase
VIALMLGFVMGRHRQGDPGARWLTASNFAYLAAVASLMARPVLGFELSAFLVIAFAYSGICLAFCSVLALEEKPLPARLLILIGVVGLSAQGYFAGHVDSATPLMATSSIVNGLLTMWMTRKVWHLLHRRGGRIALLVALPFGAISFGYLSRLLAIMLVPGGVAPLAATILIITIMSWSAIILELGMLASVERLASARLTNALAQVQHIAKAKAWERFLLSMSHELRTPLNGVIGLSALMQSQAVGPLPESYAGFAKGIHDSGVRLLDLVSNLLDVLAPHDAEQKRVLIDTSLSGVISEIEQTLAPLAGSRGVTLSCVLATPREEDNNVELWVRADKRRLVQMLRHLGENAVKYARAKAEIRVVAEPGTTASAGFVITIEDDGPGLAPHEVENALELFGRVRGVDDPNAGAGVGLTLVAAIARGHDAELQFSESALGGLAVSFRLQKGAPPGERGPPCVREVVRISIYL